MRIYAVWADMEHDEPVAYCLSEDDAKYLFHASEDTQECGDIIPCEIPDDLWLSLHRHVVVGMEV